MMIMSVTICGPIVGDNFWPPFLLVTAGVEQDANFANCFSPLLSQPNPSHDDYEDHDQGEQRPVETFKQKTISFGGVRPPRETKVRIKDKT